mgnify:CR=1 FL=1
MHNRLCTLFRPAQQITARIRLWQLWTFLCKPLSCGGLSHTYVMLMYFCHIFRLLKASKNLYKSYYLNYFPCNRFFMANANTSFYGKCEEISNIKNKLFYSWFHINFTKSRELHFKFVINFEYLCIMTCFWSFKNLFDWYLQINCSRKSRWKYWIFACILTHIEHFSHMCIY